MAARLAQCGELSADMLKVPGGTFLMGSDKHADEGPVRRVRVESFFIDRFDVTNAITVDEIKNATPDQILKRMLSLPEVSRMRGA